ncbi:MAG: hypothetical protein GF330_11410 [Candidatus Eisenbacteria bacterium]|nr:hypothetical protein [Candidatus Eisenbacteria bacterium]
MSMRTWCCTLLLVLALVPAAGADELLINGTFEEDLEVGWQQILDGGNLYRATNYDDDEDYEARAHKGTGTGGAELRQEVAIPGLDATFHAALRPLASATSSAWAGSGIRVGYLDDAGTLLGETHLGVITSYCPWENSPTFHLIELDPGVWQERGFRIDEELANLPGVDPAEVRRLRVSLLVDVYDC